MAQARIQKQATKREETQAPAPQVAATKESTKQITDDLLEEIDGILEENAEQFVANYVQKGGE